MFADIGDNTLINEKGKRTANISLNNSNSSHTSTAKEMKRQKQYKIYSLQASALLSPAKKINAIEKNKKKL